MRVFSWISSLFNNINPKDSNMLTNTDSNINTFFDNLVCEIRANRSPMEGHYDLLIARFTEDRKQLSNEELIELNALCSERKDMPRFGKWSYGMIYLASNHELKLRATKLS
jgi:hypothetical protein